MRHEHGPLALPLGITGGLATASLVGVAMTSDEWSLVPIGLAVVSAGAFGGLLDSGRPSRARAIMVLSALTYLVLIPLLGFGSRALQALGRTSSASWWMMVAVVATGLLAAFYAARRWGRRAR